MLVTDNAKVFENPDTGTFLGTIIDVVDLGKIKTNFGEKVKIRIVWVLDKNDSEGQPFRVMRQMNASVNEKAALYDVAKSVLGTAPPAPFDSETLMGRSNQLVIVKESDPKTGKVFANVKVILPLPAGAIPPPVPQGFIRSKDRPAKGMSSGAPVAAAQPATAVAPVAQANPAPAPQSAAPQPAQPAPAPDAAF